MAKFCGKCGAKLDDTTGLCPNCDADKLKEQSDKSEPIDVAKSTQEIAPTSEIADYPHPAFPFGLGRLTPSSNA